MDLNQLQEQIDYFMEFLINIQKMMLVLRDNKGKMGVAMKDLTLEDRKEIKFDGDLKRVCNTGSF